MERFIVAEITWTNKTPVENLIGSTFEKVINVNFETGYKLIDWKLSTSVHKDTLTETIIAIFESKDNGGGS